VGWVGLPPRLPCLNSYAKTVGYGWGVVHPATGGCVEGKTASLKAAKRRVEREYRRLYMT
jgi:hypothetical protein